MKRVQLKNGLMVLGMIVAMVAINTNSFAQEVEVSDEELLNYAKAMSQLDVLKSDLKAKVSEAVKSNKLMDGGRMFNKLNKAKGDEAKIAESEATPEQLAAYAGIQEEIATLKAELKAQTTEVVKANMSISSYNKVKKALKADEAIKTKYDEIAASLASEVEETEGE